MSMERSMYYGSVGVPSFDLPDSTDSNVPSLKQSTDQEKKDMQDLNQRFAGYIEQMRYKEAQIKKLTDELDKLKSTLGKERESTPIKVKYQAKFDLTRKELDEAEKKNAELVIKVASLEEKLQEEKHQHKAAQKTLFDQNKQLSDKNGEFDRLRRRIETFEIEKKKANEQIATLQENFNRCRLDLDKQTLLYIEVETRRQTLEGELEFLTSVHEQEMSEMAALAYRDTTAENREFWKNEMGPALQEIQQVYESKMESMRSEIETFYSLKVQEIRTAAARQNSETVLAKEENNRSKTQLSEIMNKLTELEARNSQLQRKLDSRQHDKEERYKELVSENSHMKNEMSQLRWEMKENRTKLQLITKTKLDLEMEIDAYRKLLESEEIRIGPKKNVKPVKLVKPDDSTMPGSPDMNGATPAKIPDQRTEKGPVAIVECSADGKFIVIENKGTKDENLGGWRLTRNVDGVDKANYTLRPDFVIRASAKVKIWAQGCRPAGASSDVESNQRSWGTGDYIKTKLINQSGDVLASFIQTTVSKKIG